MKKLLILLFAAAVIGVVISKVRGNADEPSKGVRSDQEAVAVAAAELAGPPAVREAPAPAARRAEPLNARRPAARSQPAPVEVVAAEAVREEASPPEPPAKALAATARAPAPEPAVVHVKRIEPRPVAAKRASAHPGPAVTAAIARASSLMQEGRRVEARKILSDSYLQARGASAQRLRALLDEINKDLVFNPRCTEGARIHVVQPGETLSKIGKTYGESWQMIQRVNGMTHDRINVGQQLKILEGEVDALVILSEFRLTMLIDGVYAKEYPIGIGTDEKTPPGEFVVDTMLVKPRWYKPGGGVVEYGEEGHLLGERWIGFQDQPGAAGLGIHGTNDESTIGTKCSNGCLRMRRDDVIELYDFMRRGSKVVVRP